MSLYKAKEAAERALEQARRAASMSDERKPRTEQTRIDTETAYALVNLSEAFLEFLKAQKQ